MASRRAAIGMIAIGFSVFLSIGGAAAQDYPSRPVRWVVGYPPGGATDILARLIGQRLSERLNQQFVIENKPGAGNNVGTEAVVNADPDGYTILLVNPANAINASLYSKLSFNFIRDIAPVAGIARVPNVMVVPQDFPAKTVAEFIAYAKANPGKVNMASSGNGTSIHLSGELFKAMTGVEMLHVPYRGAGPAITDLIGGQVDMIFGTAAAVSAMVDGGKLRALGVTTPERSPAFRDVPAIAETVPGYQVESWYGLFVPAGTPADVIAKLSAAARKASQTDEFRSKVQNEGLVVTAGTPAELDAYVRAEEARWRRVVRENNVKAD